VVDGRVASSPRPTSERLAGRLAEMTRSALRRVRHGREDEEPEATPPEPTDFLDMLRPAMREGRRVGGRRVGL
jgi:hypothetical protein